MGFKNDTVMEIQTVFNRCAIFETTERSWHSVPLVTLPPDKSHLSRKSFTIYLYTDTRPPNEIAAEHGTVYVQTSLPRHIKAGHVLTELDVDQIYANLERRNDYLRNLYQREYRFSEYIDRLKRNIRELEKATHIPILGYGTIAEVQKPLFPDRFMGSEIDFVMRLLRPTKGVRLFGYRPETFDSAVDIALRVGDLVATHSANGGTFEIGVEFTAPISGPARVCISASKTQRPPNPGDERALSIIVDRIELY